MTGVPRYLLDTNVLLRFLRKDHEEYSPASRKLFTLALNGKVALEIPFITIVETVHLLRTLYKVERAEAVRELLKIFHAPGVALSAPGWIQDALNEYQLMNISFADACIAAESRHSGKRIASFDRDFDRLTGVERFEPK